VSAHNKQVGSTRNSAQQPCGAAVGLSPSSAISTLLLRRIFSTGRPHALSLAVKQRSLVAMNATESATGATETVAAEARSAAADGMGVLLAPSPSPPAAMSKNQLKKLAKLEKHAAKKAAKVCFATGRKLLQASAVHATSTRSWSRRRCTAVTSPPLF
jgi:hypothetical protein